MYHVLLDLKLFARDTKLVQSAQAIQQDSKIQVSIVVKVVKCMFWH